MSVQKGHIAAERRRCATANMKQFVQPKAGATKRLKQAADVPVEFLAEARLFHWEVG